MEPTVEEIEEKGLMTMMMAGKKQTLEERMLTDEEAEKKLERTKITKRMEFKCSRGGRSLPGIPRTLSMRLSSPPRMKTFKTKFDSTMNRSRKRSRILTVPLESQLCQIRSGSTSVLTDTLTSTKSPAIPLQLRLMEQPLFTSETTHLNSQGPNRLRRFPTMGSGSMPSWYTKMQPCSRSKDVTSSSKRTSSTSTTSSPAPIQSSINVSLTTTKWCESTSENEEMPCSMSSRSSPNSGWRIWNQPESLSRARKEKAEEEAREENWMLVETGTMATVPELIAATNTNINQPEPTAELFVSKLAQAAWGRGVVEVEDGVDEVFKVKDWGRVSFMPKYRRGFGWKDGVMCSSRAVGYTLVDEPLPRPPASEYENKPAMKTIHYNLDLFQVPHFVNVDRFEEMLKGHPNRPLVCSVVEGLRHGFWPFADTKHADGYPETWDNSWAPPPTEYKRDFINDQCDDEVRKGRFSHTFGPDLLPGMYSTPTIAVPKPHMEKLHLVVNQSAGEFCQNSMVDQVITKGARMDTIKELLTGLLEFKRENLRTKLVMFKSDISEVYRLMPLHPLWQIKQVTMSNLPTKNELKMGEVHQRL
ncbi:hypothetical protein BT96DRAFT_989188 [Gymnopus androsaceus JB14]|uniref:Uncharacterized protein n=1 Tax=Gymnopus androsaceus JB14 TaxID=1447944 RepID=A0A6A4I5C0_9AGAR|nr:hypothetical protein BT96DRAFT_989188 [Gymnopus androsaceus JB14]